MNKLLFFITIFSFSSAQEMLVYGHVYSSILVNNEINPISNAQVGIGMDSVPEGTLTFTNEEGYYELTFDWNWDGPIPIVCEADNYDFFIATIMPNNTQIEFDIQLNPINSDEECTEEECGPPPMMPNYLCSDGVTIAGPGECIENLNNECYWEIIECPILFGYLVQYDISDCQDECSQYTIELEIDSGVGPVPVISQNSELNMDLYVNRFVEVDLGQAVTCVECNAFAINQINLSDECQFPVDCLENPCYEVDYCDINIPVECVANYCGGCYADFYDLEGNLVDCNMPIEECEDLSGIDFGVCAMVLGIGYVNGECNYVSGCDWIINGIDYSDSFFDSIEECEETCDNSDSTDIGDINGDGYINVLDIVLLVGFILQTDFPSDSEFFAADYNEDNELNVLDVIQLVNIILGANGNTVTDIDGNIYETILIGDQLWMTENLKVTHYQNSDEIPYIYNNPQYGAYINYNNNADNVAVYGRLYNWFTVNDERGLCPDNWHVPSDDEFKSLEMYLGMSESEANGEGLRGTDEGGKLKEEGIEHWDSPNTGATNGIGFTALPSGNRRYETYTNQEIFSGLNRYGFFWSSSEVYTVNAWYRVLSYDYSESNRYHLSKANAFSIRCVED